MVDAPLADASDRGHRRIQTVLRAGLILSVVAMAAGFAVDLAEGQMAAVSVRISSIFHAGSVGDRMMAVGILALVLTPVVRVAALVVVWAREHDRRFAWVGVTVLAILLLGIVLGRA